MKINYLDIIGTIINFGILFTMLLMLFKGTRGIKNFIRRNKETEGKIDLILSKLDNKQDN